MELSHRFTVPIGAQVTEADEESFSGSVKVKLGPIALLYNGSGTFDSFECAIHALAPTCAHCQCRIIGHGAEHDGTFYCCAHCAKQAGVTGIDDRA